MRASFVILGLMVIVAVTTAEMCSMASDCKNLNCAGMERCEDQVCTCDDNQHNQMCKVQSDCAHMHLHGHCRPDQAHCVDSRCRCMH